MLKLPHTGCSRYDGSYSNLVAQQLGVDPKDLDFTYTACSGAVIQDVKEQAKALSNGQQYVIVSAVRFTSTIESNVVTYRWEQGGNDADLVGILNSCVYSFWGGLKHPSCEKKLSESGDTIRSDQFASKVDDLITTIKPKLAQGGNMYPTP